VAARGAGGAVLPDVRERCGHLGHADQLDDGGPTMIIGGISAAGLAVIILIILLIKGGGGRLAIVLAALAGSALGIATSLFAVLATLADKVTEVANSLGGGFG
jgi:hypothetical protein